MLSKLQPKNIVEIRNNFGAHPLFVAVQEACCDCCALPVIFQFRPEHVFIEVISLIDTLKEKQEDIVWTKLFNQIRQDYRYLDSSIPDEELNIISAIVCTTLASVLVISIPTFYHRIGEQLLQLVFAHDNDVPREKLYALCDGMEKHEAPLKAWMEEYSHSDEFLSNHFAVFYSDTSMDTDQGSPKHIRFVVGVSVTLRNEFKEAIKHAIEDKKNWGKAAKIKNLLLYYKNEDVIVLDGTEIDIYNDLYTYFGYRQSDKTFYAAEPKLGKT